MTIELVNINYPSQFYTQMYHFKTTILHPDSPEAYSQSYNAKYIQ